MSGTYMVVDTKKNRILKRKGMYILNFKQASKKFLRKAKKVENGQDYMRYALVKILRDGVVFEDELKGRGQYKADAEGISIGHMRFMVLDMLNGRAHKHNGKILLDLDEAESIYVRNGYESEDHNKCDKVLLVNVVEIWY